MHLPPDETQDPRVAPPHLDGHASAALQFPSGFILVNKMLSDTGAYEGRWVGARVGTSVQFAEGIVVGVIVGNTEG